MIVLFFQKLRKPRELHVCATVSCHARPCEVLEFFFRSFRRPFQEFQEGMSVRVCAAMSC